MRELLKTLARALATVLVLPALASYWLRATVMGRDRALEGSTQALGLVPGLAGQYLRRAFLARVLAECHPTAAIEFGTLFSSADARLEAGVYVGPRCHLGLVHVERGALIAAGVHVPSGGHIHPTDTEGPPGDQPLQRRLVRIGAEAWIGSAAVVMADVARRSIVGAGSVVTRPVPDEVVAAGVPARAIRSRAAAAGSGV